MVWLLDERSRCASPCAHQGRASQPTALLSRSSGQVSRSRYPCKAAADSSVHSFPDEDRNWQARTETEGGDCLFRWRSRCLSNWQVRSQIPQHHRHGRTYARRIKASAAYGYLAFVASSDKGAAPSTTQARRGTQSLLCRR